MEVSPENALFQATQTSEDGAAVPMVRLSNSSSETDSLSVGLGGLDPRLRFGRGQLGGLQKWNCVWLRLRSRDRGIPCVPLAICWEKSARAPPSVASENPSFSHPTWFAKQRKNLLARPLFRTCSDGGAETYSPLLITMPWE